MWTPATGTRGGIKMGHFCRRPLWTTPKGNNSQEYYYDQTKRSEVEFAEWQTTSVRYPEILEQAKKQCTTWRNFLKEKSRDVPVIHPVPGKCRISHYPVLPGPSKIMGPSNKKKFFFTFYFLLP